MKKKSLKLQLKKVNVSNLSSVRGGNDSNMVGCVYTVSMNFLDLCCPILGTEECPDPKPKPSKNELNCNYTVAGDCSLGCFPTEGPNCE